MKNKDLMLKYWREGFEAGYKLADGLAALKECKDMKEGILYLSGFGHEHMKFRKGQRKETINIHTK